MIPLEKQGHEDHARSHRETRGHAEHRRFNGGGCTCLGIHKHNINCARSIVKLIHVLNILTVYLFFRDLSVTLFRVTVHKVQILVVEHVVITVLIVIFLEGKGSVNGKALVNQLVDLGFANEGMRIHVAPRIVANGIFAVHIAFTGRNGGQPQGIVKLGVVLVEGNVGIGARVVPLETAKFADSESARGGRVQQGRLAMVSGSECGGGRAQGQKRSDGKDEFHVDVDEK